MSKLRLLLASSVFVVLATHNCWSRTLMTGTPAMFSMQDSGSADKMQGSRSADKKTDKATDTTGKKDEKYKKTHKKAKKANSDDACGKGGTEGKRPCDGDKK